MRYSSQIKPISYLKKRTAAVVMEITGSRTPKIITQNGEATFMVQDIRSFEQAQQTMAQAIERRWPVPARSLGTPA